MYIIYVVCSSLVWKWVCPGIVDYMSEQAGPPSKQVQAVKQIQELVKDGDDAVIVGMFSSDEDAAYETYQEACKCQNSLGSAQLFIFYQLTRNQKKVVI